MDHQTYRFYSPRAVWSITLDNNQTYFLPQINKTEAFTKTDPFGILLSSLLLNSSIDFHIVSFLAQSRTWMQELSLYQQTLPKSSVCEFDRSSSELLASINCEASDVPSPFNVTIYQYFGIFQNIWRFMHALLNIWGVKSRLNFIRRTLPGTRKFTELVSSMARTKHWIGWSIIQWTSVF